MTEQTVAPRVKKEMMTHALTSGKLRSLRQLASRPWVCVTRSSHEMWSRDAMVRDLLSLESAENRGKHGDNGTVAHGIYHRCPRGLAWAAVVGTSADRGGG